MNRGGEPDQCGGRKGDGRKRRANVALRARRLNMSFVYGSERKAKMISNDIVGFIFDKRGALEGRRVLGAVCSLFRPLYSKAAEEELC